MRNGGLNEPKESYEERNGRCTDETKEDVWMK